MHGAYTLKSMKWPWSVTSTRPSASISTSLSGLNSPAMVPGEPKKWASPSDVVHASVRRPEPDLTKVATPE